MRVYTVQPYMMHTMELLITGVDELSSLVFRFYIEMKELCEARAKPEMSSNLADKPSLANVLLPQETAGEKSELFTDLCHQ